MTNTLIQRLRDYGCCNIRKDAAVSRAQPAAPADAAPSVAPEPREQQTQKSINLLRSALLRIEHAQSIHTAHALAESALRKWRSQNGEGHENCDV